MGKLEAHEKCMHGATTKTSLPETYPERGEPGNRIHIFLSVELTDARKTQEKEKRDMIK
jgi:hypothetical protein